MFFFLVKSLSSEVTLEHSKLPDGVTIQYKSFCKNGVTQTGDDGRRCFNISIGDEVIFLRTPYGRKEGRSGNVGPVYRLGTSEVLEGSAGWSGFYKQEISDTLTSACAFTLKKSR